MILFWSLSAVLGAAVLGLILRPLLARRAPGDARSARALNLSVYRDQLRELDGELRAGALSPAEHETARRELERRLLEDVAGPEAPAPRPGGRGLALAAAAAIPLGALAVYVVVGNPGSSEPPLRHIERMVERLAARLQDQPEDVEGWKLLGRSYAALGRYSASAEAYGKAAARAPRDAGLLADFADALAMARGRQLAGDPEKLIARALEADPNNLKALALAGTAAFERKDFAQALAYWERMLPLVDADSEDARTIRANVEEAKALAGQSIAGRTLKGVVRISPRLASKVGPGDTVFIFARAAEGPPMPLAVLRRPARELPLAFSLDDSMAMSPAARLSAFPRVVVGARISKSGSANRHPGDLQGASAVVANDASGVTVTIDTVAR